MTAYCNAKNFSESKYAYRRILKEEGDDAAQKFLKHSRQTIVPLFCLDPVQAWRKPD
jgi:hypothetical protein